MGWIGSDVQRSVVIDERMRGSAGMLGWTHTAVPQRCAACGRTAVLRADTHRCEWCEIDTYDAKMLRMFPDWYTRWGPVFREAEARRRAEQGAA